MEKLNFKALGQKVEELNRVSIQLKEEYAGLDKEIDRLIIEVQSWYCFHHLQTRPSVINIWGMTGTGKTSLILRMMQLLGLDQDTFKVDMGVLNQNEYGLYVLQSELLEKKNASVLIFDEFQQFKTLNEEGKELTESGNRFFWELIDSGITSFQEVNCQRAQLQEVIEDLEVILCHGIVVENGVVVEGLDTYNRLSNLLFKRRFGEEESEVKRFFPTSFFGYLTNAIEKSMMPSLVVIEKELLQLDGPQTIKYLKEFVRKSHQPRKLDVRNGLIFCIGNLDEAHPMSNQISQIQSADHYHQLSLKIGLTEIKQALQKRFRAEQIARLGNRHLVFPSLSSASYRSVIKLELARLASVFQTQSGVSIRFTAGLEDYLYNKGVFPTQGVRPLYSTISSELESLFPQWYMFISPFLGQNELSIEVDWHQSIKWLRCFQGENVLGVWKSEAPLGIDLGQLEQVELSIVAIHEAAHALVYMACHGITPLSINVLNPEGNLEGVVHCLASSFYSMKRLRDLVKAKLAGYVAEEMIFGRDLITSGSIEDIESLTRDVFLAFGSFGFGNLPMKFGNKSPLFENFVLPQKEEFFEHAKEFVMEQHNWVKSFLWENQYSLKVLASKLKLKGYLTPDELVVIMKSLGWEISPAMLDTFPAYGEYEDALQEFFEMDKEYLVAN